MNMTSFLQDKRLTIALKGEIDHHSAKDTMRIIGNKIDIYVNSTAEAYRWGRRTVTIYILE